MNWLLHQALGTPNNGELWFVMLWMLLLTITKRDK